MAAIQTLLNPLPEVTADSGSEYEQPSKTRYDIHEHGASTQARKKQKIVKDAAIFTRGPIRGECRYPPHEFQDELLAAQHQQFEVYPMGEIADYPRHIPYNSEKKAFLEKTGRDSLEVFQYRFKVSGEDSTYSMLWEYNIGLVRTTPLFKCTGHSKTTPAKMLNRNPGLREICHSITGGALVAQGYWMPYDAAKAVAATFCWKIRYALTPVFGIDFPGLCVPPESERFGDMVIDPVITKRCTEQAKLYRDMESQTSRASTVTPGPPTPDTPTYPHRSKLFRPKNLKLNNSAYASDASSEDNYGITSPEVGYRSIWTPANTPRSIPRQDSPSSTMLMTTSTTYDAKSPTPGLYPTTARRNQVSSPSLSPKSRRIDFDEMQEHSRNHEYEDERESENERRRGRTELPRFNHVHNTTNINNYVRDRSRDRDRDTNAKEYTSDENAARLLMSLRKRRAST